jgi:hypothetical protein
LGQDAELHAGRFYHDWAAAEFGERAADKIAAIYKDYFATPARGSMGPEREFGDQYYHTEARMLLLAQMVGSPTYSLPGQSPTWTVPRVFDFPGGRNRIAEMAGEDTHRCRDVQARWDALWNRAVEAEPLVSPERQPFYRFHVLAMIAIGKESNRMLALTGEAIQQAGAGNRAAARAAAQRALVAIGEIRKAETGAEYGKWKNWYRGDWLTNIGRTGELLGIFLKQIDDPLSPMPPPIRWDGWEAYHHIMNYEGDRSADVK